MQNRIQISQYISTFFILLSTTLTSCSTSSKNNANNLIENYPLSAAEKFKPGNHSKAEIENHFGKPDKVFQFKKEKSESWVYLNSDKKASRISFTFDHDSKLVKTGWFPESADPEIDLENSLKHYYPSKFVHLETPWNSGHSAPNQEIYRNSSLGIDIVHLTGSKTVEAIEFSVPSGRTPARK